MRKLSEKSIIILFLIILIFPATGLFLVISKKTSISSGQHSELLKVEVAQRGTDPSDIWRTSIPALNSTKPGSGELVGIVYSGILENYASKIVLNWSLELEIEEDCYLNNCWNGSVEILQHNGRHFVKQKFMSFKSINPRDMKIDYIFSRQKNLLIPLKKGDKVIYYSDKIVNAHIKGFNPSDEFGFIFYTPENADPLEFNNWKLNYEYKDAIFYEPSFYVFSVMLLIWAIFFIFIIRVRSLKASKERDRFHDQQTIEQIMKILSNFIDAKDAYTGGHAERVGLYSKMIAEVLGKSETEARTIYYCGLLHDCGKIAIPDEILRKPERLTDEEFSVIKTHTTKGFTLLNTLSSIPEACEVARFHHERWDGRGYPYGLKGKDIPEFARIVCLADSFDTMNSNRYYRNALKKEQIVEELTKAKGTQFDPQIVDAFLSLIDKGIIIFKNN